MSFSIPATIPAGTNTNTVTLSGIEFFFRDAAGFNVYRGPNPTALLLIAPNIAVAATYTDTGATPELHRSAGCKLRSREFLLAAGIAAGDGREYCFIDDDRQQHAGDAGERFRGRGGADHARDRRDARSGGGFEYGDNVDGVAGVDGDAGYDELFCGGRARPGISADPSATSPVEIDVPNQTGATVEISGTVGERAGSGKRGGVESADAMADRRRVGRRSG